MEKNPQIFICITYLMKIFSEIKKLMYIVKEHSMCQRKIKFISKFIPMQLPHYKSIKNIQKYMNKL